VQTHRIKRQVIELTVHDATAARQLHNEISRIYHRRIVPLIDRYCSELSAPDQLHRIETLVLDVGSIDILHLEAELVASVEAALRPTLAAQVEAQAQAAKSPEDRPDVQAWLELFALFARSGSLPWWADATAPRLLEDGMQHLLQHAPAALVRLVRTLAHEPHALQRLGDHLPDALLAELVGQLAPVIQTEPVDDLPTLITRLQQTPAASSHPPAWLRRHAWMMFLQVASIAGAHYTALSFYQAVLQRLADILGIPYASLRAAVQPADESTTSSTPEQMVPADLWALLRRLAERLAPPLRAELLAALDARDSGESLQVTARRILHLLQSNQAQQVLPADEVRPMLRMLQAAGGTGAEQPANAAGLEIDPGLGPVDEIYISNAGLVILWPFLSQFFARLELLDGRQFRDYAAQQRAIALLQHIATGDQTCPEYVLPLNKLLCGLDPTALFDMLEPLYEAEMAECTNLLTAVIAQAPVLRTMSPSGFQGTFLLRQGMLSIRDGVWLLRVERQTYDIVLERFPWGWEWVKLPWMDAPLRVEW
jgi:hypothetical protein